MQGGYRRDLVVQAEQDCGTWPLARSRRAKARQGQPCCSQRSAHGRDHRHFTPAGHTAAQSREAEEQTAHRLSTHDGIASLPPASMVLGGKASAGTLMAHHTLVGWCGPHACTWEGPPTHPVSTELESIRQSTGRLEAQAGSIGHGSAHRGSSVATEISASSQCSPVSSEFRRRSGCHTVAETRG